MVRDVWRALGKRVDLARRRADDVPGTLAHLRELRNLIDQLYDTELVRGRAQGYPLAVLGPTKQAAYERHKAALGRSAQQPAEVPVQDGLLWL